MQKDVMLILQIIASFIQSVKQKDGSLLREGSGGGDRWKILCHCYVQ